MWQLGFRVNVMMALAIKWELCTSITFGKLELEHGQIFYHIGETNKQTNKYWTGVTDGIGNQLGIKGLGYKELGFNDPRSQITTYLLPDLLQKLTC